MFNGAWDRVRSSGVVANPGAEPAQSGSGGDGAYPGQAGQTPAVPLDWHSAQSGNGNGGAYSGRAGCGRST